MVDTTRLPDRPMPLRELVAMLEEQTRLTFLYDADRVPLGAIVPVPRRAAIPLEEVLAAASSQVPVIFRQRAEFVAILNKGPADVAPDRATPGDARPPASPVRVAGLPPREEAPDARGPAPEPFGATALPESLLAQPAAMERAQPTAGDQVVEMERFQVQGSVVEGSASALRSLRMRADVAIDTLSADQIAKFGAGDLAEVVIRIPGVSVAGGQFAVIRGLSDRYTNTTLNGLKLPSPDPEKQSPQLDLLPTTLVNSVVVSKSFAPYLWADTSGGSIDLTTEGDPDGRKFSISYGLRVNDNARNGGPRYEIPDRKNDWLASGTKSRPAATLAGFRAPWDFVPQQDDLPIGQKLSLNYGDTFRAWDRAVSFNLSGGYEIASSARGGERQVLLVGHTGDVETLENSEFRSGRPTLLDGGTWDYEQSEVDVTTTALGSLGVALSDNHRMRAVGFWTRTGTDATQVNTSPLTRYSYRNSAGNIVETQVAFDQGERRAGDYDEFKPQALRRHRDVQVYTERKLGTVQFSGRHAFPAAGGLQLDWVTQRASTYQDEPNLVDARYYYQLAANPPDSDFNYGIPIGDFGIPPSGVANMNRFWGRTTETQGTYRLDGEWPQLNFLGREARLRFGVARENTERQFEGSNYTGIFHDLTLDQRTGPNPDEAFNALVRADAPLSNRTEQDRAVTATFVNMTFKLPGRVDLLAGARFERFSIRTEGKDVVNRTATGFLYHYAAFPIFGADQIAALENPATAQAFVSRVRFSELGWYPSLGLVFRPAASWTLRMTASQTSGRPSLREMGPYYNRSLESGEYVVGNPYLRTSKVTNLDARVEWTPSRSSRYAVSLFTKRIETPIEKVFLPGAVNGEGVESWSNNPNTADLRGAEFEFSQALGAGFTLGGNFTWIDAEIEEHPAVIQKLRTKFHLAPDESVVRPLFDQPEYIANLDLTWARPQWGTAFTVTGYAISDVLESAGGGTVFGTADSALDLYDRAYQRVDVTLSQTLFAGLRLRVNARNLTDPDRGTIYDPNRTAEEITRNAYRLGRTYSVTLSRSF